MVRMFRTSDGAIHEIQEPQDGCWVALTNPTATEIFEISEQFQIEVDDLRAPLDEEERSRIEVEDNYTLILVDVPMIEERNDKDWYGTIPLGIIVTDKMIFTVCLEDTQVLTRFMEGRVRNFFTYMKTRFILQILYRNSSMYLRYLRIIDKKSEQVEEKLHFSPRNQELIELLELEKSLVYFTTSLRSNEAVLECIWNEPGTVRNAFLQYDLGISDRNSGLYCGQYHCSTFPVKKEIFLIRQVFIFPNSTY